MKYGIQIYSFVNKLMPLIFVETYSVADYKLLQANDSVYKF